jgi:hypothetical protein
MIIANRLLDGLVVFFAAEGRWTTEIGEGLVIGDDGDADASLGAAKRDEEACLVIDPQLIDVAEDAAGKPRPTAIREAIRAFGPTV